MVMSGFAEIYRILLNTKWPNNLIMPSEASTNGAVVLGKHCLHIMLLLKNNKLYLFVPGIVALVGQG